MVEVSRSAQLEISLGEQDFAATMSSRILEQIGSSEDENFIGVEIDKESGGRNIEGNSGRSGKFSQVQLELIRECFDFFDRSMKDSLDVKVIPEAIRSLGIPIRHEEISTLLAQAVVSESTAEVPFNVFVRLSQHKQAISNFFLKRFLCFL